MKTRHQRFKKFWRCFDVLLTIIGHSEGWKFWHATFSRAPVIVHFLALFTKYNLGTLHPETVNIKRDGRLAPADFSPNYKYFDQLWQRVKNKTTVLILVFKEFLQTSIRPLISVLYAKGYHDFPLKNFCLTSPKNFVEEPFCVSENFWYRKRLGIREGAGITIFCQNFLSHSAEKNRRGTLLCCVSESFW